MTSAQYLAAVKRIFQENGDPDRAQRQMRYMRHQFEYYGLKANEWVALGKDIMQEHGVPEGEYLKELVRLCFADEHREVNYFGLELVQKNIKKQPEEFIHFIEELIVSKSWWETVDWIATKMAGVHFKKYPHLIRPVTERWMASGNIWLQRVSLIFQLMYRQQTDFELMKKYILQLAGSREFFIQKGAGWALRQYSKYNPTAVTDFIGKHPQLAPLTRREGLKWLKNRELV